MSNSYLNGMWQLSFTCSFLSICPFLIMTEKNIKAKTWVKSSVNYYSNNSRGSHLNTSQKHVPWFFCLLLLTCSLEHWNWQWRWFRKSVAAHSTMSWETVMTFNILAHTFYNEGTHAHTLTKQREGVCVIIRWSCHATLELLLLLLKRWQINDPNQYCCNNEKSSA